MPVSIGMTFLIGGILGWIVVKILRPERHFEGLIIGSCSAANLGYLPLVLVPAICDETGSPFGEASICHSRGLSYVALSMSFSSIYIWTHTYSLMRKSGVLYEKFCNKARTSEASNKDFMGSGECDIIKIQDEGSSNNKVISVRQSKDIAGHEEVSNKDIERGGECGIGEIQGEGSSSDKVIPFRQSKDIAGHDKAVPLLPASDLGDDHVFSWGKLKGILKRVVEELLAPPTIAAIIGLIVGVTPSMKSLIIGSAAPLRVIQETTKTLGNAVLPCVTLILGGNLLQGLRNSQLKPLVIIMTVIVRNVILPIAGIFVVKAANHFGFLAKDPLYQYVLMLQFALPPATSIGSMAQLFDVAKEECSVIFLWTYLVSAFTLTIWSTVFLWLLS